MSVIQQSLLAERAENDLLVALFVGGLTAIIFSLWIVAYSGSTESFALLMSE